MVNIALDNGKCNAHFLLVKNKLQQRSEAILKLGYINKGRKKLYVNDDCTFFLQSLLEDSFLENIICCIPADIPFLIDELVNAFPSSVDSATELYNIIYNVFIDNGYNSPTFSKLAFIDNIGKDTCLYCNRNYIYTLEEKDKLKPEIDHFYPKGVYPFLGLTYYNLIPSCELCNGNNCKGETDPRVCGLTNPYLIKDSDFRFTYTIKSIKVLNPLSDLSSVKISFKSKLQPHLDVFKLDKLYEKHTDHLLELVIKSKLRYTDHYRKYLKSYKRLKFSRDEINRMIIGNYSKIEDVHRRPLAKLYQDIALELGLIKL